MQINKKDCRLVMVVDQQYAQSTTDNRACFGCLPYIFLYSKYYVFLSDIKRKCIMGNPSNRKSKPKRRKNFSFLQRTTT